MARVQLSALLNDISGKLNGSIFQRTQGGLCIRSNSGKINSNTISSNKRRVGLSIVQNAWTSLTDAERLQWKIYSQYIQIKQKKNPTLYVNGHQLFINYNTLRLALSYNNLLFTPALCTVPIMAPLGQPISINSLHMNGVALEVNLSYIVNNAQEVIILYMSRVLSPSQISGYQKLILMDAPTNSGNQFECNAVYYNTYGYRPTIGDWVQTKISIYDITRQSYTTYAEQRIQFT